MSRPAPAMQEIHFVSSITEKGTGGGTTAWMNLLAGAPAPVVLHYSSHARPVWAGFAARGVRHLEHEGWRTYEHRGHAAYDDSPRGFVASRIPAGATVVLDSIEGVRQLTPALAARGCRLVWHVHSPHRLLRRSPLDTARDLRRLRRLDRLIFVSRFLEERFRRSPLNRLLSPLVPLRAAVVYSGVGGNPGREPVPAPPSSVGYFGRYEAYKNPLFLEELGPQVRYIGTAEGCTSPVRVPAERDLGWMGPDEAAGRGDVFVFPSVDEAFGLAVVEMMLRGKIVVCFRSGAFPEIVEDGVDGFLVPPFDASGARRVLDRLRADPALAQSVRRRAIDKAATFGIERYRDDFFGRLIGWRPGEATRG